MSSSISKVSCSSKMSEPLNEDEAESSFMDVDSIMTDPSTTRVKVESMETSGNIIFSPQDLLPSAKLMKRSRPKTKVKQSLSDSVQEVEHSDSSFNCEICNKDFAKEGTLIQHMSIHCNVKPFQCSHCDKSFTRKVHLQGHLATHGIRKQFECPICHQRFSRQDCVKIHMRIHDKSKCFYCSVCLKAFLTNGALDIHMRIHRGEKPFKCHICGKCFTQKTHLITHIKKHTRIADDHFTKKLGPRMFKCGHCTRSFIRLSDYERHVQWNHGTIGESNYDNFKYEDNASSDKESKYQTYNTPTKVVHKKKSLTETFSSIRTCTTSTQTDEEGGHVIIPRKYQSHTTTTSTQVSAPPTPRPTDEDTYENDIFDEGMDRNYSSDEDDDNQEEGSQYLTNDFSASIGEPKESDQNDAFDEVRMGKGKPEGNKKQNKNDSSSSAEKTIERFLENKRLRDAKSNINESQSPPNVDPNSPNKKNYLDSLRIGKQSVNTPKPRGRPRGAYKKSLLLTGPTELRLIRKSMMAFISEKQSTEQSSKEEEVEEQSITVTEQADGGLLASVETVTEPVDNRTRRATKLKQHGKDFVCTMKGCELCNPVKEKTNEAPIIVKVEKTLKNEHSGQKNKLIQLNADNKTSNHSSTHKSLKNEHSDKNLQPKNDENSTKRFFKILDNFTSEHNKNSGIEEQYRKGSNAYNSDDPNYLFVSSNTENEIVTPPVEVQSFCIPTYSCKLCGREFRFEGKLHRHIESVHQNKNIFSPDIKPGRSNHNRKNASSYDYSMNDAVVTSLSAQNEERVVKKKDDSKVNPVIAALHSEWDDDDDDDDEDHEEEFEEKNMNRESEHEFSQITSRIVATNNRGNYVREVKVNMNKITGIVPEHPSVYQTMYPKSTTKVVPKICEDTSSSLDTKCLKLLEKLFDIDLLRECGLGDDHVSVVLGRILQHYGVKMIEEYGQGQYEVLKYNLWRLIEWKVTMEQMEEFYTEGKSVEEMMDDIMNNRVPLVSHDIQISKEETVSQVVNQNIPTTATTSIVAGNSYQAGGHQVTTVNMNDSQMVLSQMGVLSGNLNLNDGMTQVVLAQDLSPEMLQGAQIVTIDPTTGQVLSQITADQVILADHMSDLSGSHVVEMSQQNIISHSSMNTSDGCITTFAPGTIIPSNMGSPIVSQVILPHSQTNTIKVTTSGNM